MMHIYKSLTHHTLSRCLAVVVFMCGIVLGTSLTNAQVSCPSGSVQVTKVAKMVYNGICCDVQITYCLLPGSTFHVMLLDATVLDASCWGLSPGDPPPFTANYLVKYVRDLAIRDALGSTIPVCPTMLTYTVAFSNGTCAELKTRIVDPDGPGGQPEYLQLYLEWCTDVLCTRECQICLNTTDVDPCTQEPRIYYSCFPGFNPGCPVVVQPTMCENLCGS
ncbi:MAG: hypothetical protein OKBPIBMD_00274 [Chlorobi bacterium]|nr:hypothetical protein [Chlorobiota bacterium]